VAQLLVTTGLAQQPPPDATGSAAGPAAPFEAVDRLSHPKEMNQLICEAIRNRWLLEFSYHGLQRIVEPYCHGINHRGEEMLRAVQIAGSSASGGLGFGKLWRVKEVHQLCATGRPFSPSDPNYNPNDTAMKTIHCRV
jgi:hypothetical protein